MASVWTQLEDRLLAESWVFTYHTSHRVAPSVTPASAPAQQHTVPRGRVWVRDPAVLGEGRAGDAPLQRTAPLSHTCRASPGLPQHLLNKPRADVTASAAGQPRWDLKEDRLKVPPTPSPLWGPSHDPAVDRTSALLCGHPHRVGQGSQVMR